jgi:hypothetical protein
LASWGSILSALQLLSLRPAILMNFDVLIGLQEASMLGWLLPAIVVLPGVLGMFWALRLRRYRAEVYLRVGRGGDL